MVNVLRTLGSALVPTGGNKIGSVKHYQSLAPSAQKYGVAIGELRTLVNSGYNESIDEAKNEFRTLAEEICERMGM